MKKVGRLAANKLLFNTFIRTFITGYLVFALAAFQNLNNLVFSTIGQTVNSVLVIIMAFICLVASFLIGSFVMVDFSKLN